MTTKSLLTRTDVSEEPATEERIVLLHPVPLSAPSSRHDADDGNRQHSLLRCPCTSATILAVTSERTTASRVVQSIFDLCLPTLYVIWVAHQNVSTYTAKWRQITIHAVGFDLAIQDLYA